MPTPLPLAPFTPGEEDRPPTHMLRMMLVVASNDDGVSSPYCGLPLASPRAVDARAWLLFARRPGEAALGHHWPICDEHRRLSLPHDHRELLGRKLSAAR